ncbi:alpha/beta fold hydrolase [Streptomyces malaysiensis]|nr:alpha/beta hydrolase [Streptomyces malaysiensis]
MTDTPLVLIPGAQHGAWCWRKMLRPLRPLGYEAHPITLTGLSERSHLLTADVDLNTHITDVFRLIEAEELIGVTLVGHSYGGLVAAGATARLRHPAVRRLVYLDSPIPLDGDSIMTMTPFGEQLRRCARRSTESGSSRPVTRPPWGSISPWAVSPRPHAPPMEPVSTARPSARPRAP